MLRICIDMDEVLADTLTEHLRRYNEHFSENITIEDLHGKGLWDVVSHDRQEQLRAFLDEGTFFADLPLMEDAQWVVRDLSTRFEVFIATSAMTVPNSFNAKYAWLMKYFPFLPPTHYVFCGDKSILFADYLIDDLPRNLTRFKGTGLLYSAPHNMTVEGFRRVNNWREVASYFANQQHALQGLGA